MSGRIYSVKDLNEYVRKLVANEPFLQRIQVQGEVSNYSAPRSGHIYFSLKDESGKIPVAMFRSSVRGLAAPIHDGDKVVVTGEVTVYTRGGYYQIVASKISPAGVGDLHTQFELLKKKLGEEGLFDDEHKKPIPKYVTSVGIVTARSGAVIRDIIRISKRRNPHVRLLLYPVLVQGDGAAEQIVEGIRTMDRLGMDVIIVGRGGGSIEDLWAFNEEVVARAIYACDTPIVSAVGHETDTTIADFAADRRAATPSEAAELCVFDYGQFCGDLATMQTALDIRMRRMLDDAKRTVAMEEDKLLLLHPSKRIERQKERLDKMQQSLSQALRVSRERDMQRTADMQRRLDRAIRISREWEAQRTSDMQRRFTQAIRDSVGKSSYQLAIYAERLDGRSPLKKLSSGYGYVTDEGGKRIRSIADVASGTELVTYVGDGKIHSKVEGTEPVAFSQRTT